MSEKIFAVAKRGSAGRLPALRYERSLRRTRTVSNLTPEIRKRGTYAVNDPCSTGVPVRAGDCGWSALKKNYLLSRIIRAILEKTDFHRIKCPAS